MAPNNGRIAIVGSPECLVMEQGIARAVYHQRCDAAMRIVNEKP
jgi:hypothetical protein